MAWEYVELLSPAEILEFEDNILKGYTENKNMKILWKFLWKMKIFSILISYLKKEWHK